MITKLTVLADVDLMFGILAISLQITTFSLYGIDNPIDAASSGLWGGLVFLATAAFIISDRPVKWIRTMAALSVVSGVVIISLYSWRINDFIVRSTNNDANYCRHISTSSVMGNDYCDEIVMSSLFIAVGISSALFNCAVLIWVNTWKSLPLDLNNIL